MTLDSILKDLVSSVDGAKGAIVLASDGESVQCYSSNGGGERLLLRGAYLAVARQALQRSASRIGLGPLRNLVLEYDGANLIAEEIDEDCFLVLELNAGTNIGEAVYRLRKSRDILRHQINV